MDVYDNTIFQVRDTVLAYLDRSIVYGKIININEFRPPQSKYAIEICSFAGEPPEDDVAFVGAKNLIKMEEYIS